MNDKIIECKICKSEMREYEGNNPQPLLSDFEDRVCRNCNDYVTASRLVFRGINSQSIEIIRGIIVQIISMASFFRKGRETLTQDMADLLLMEEE